MVMMNDIWTAERLTETAHRLFREERDKKRLDGWFLAKEMEYECREEDDRCSEEMRSAHRLRRAVERLPLSLSEHSIFAGTQRDAFARLTPLSRWNPLAATATQLQSTMISSRMRP